MTSLRSRRLFGSIATRPTDSHGRKLVAFLAPATSSQIGYMNPATATSLAGGSKFAYALLTIARWVTAAAALD